MNTIQSAPTPATVPCLAFEAVTLPDGAGDSSPDGFSFALFPIGDGDERPKTEVTARLTVTARIRPHDLSRVNGKWFMEFSILSPDDAPDDAASGPMFGVEVGGAGKLAFEDAMALVCGAGRV